jgi:hypothetical protein
MSAILLPLALIVIVAVLLSFRLKPNQTMTCPYCELQFTKDLLLLQEYALVQCRFCHKWMRARKIFNQYHTQKIF